MAIISVCVSAHVVVAIAIYCSRCGCCCHRCNLFVRLQQSFVATFALVCADPLYVPFAGVRVGVGVGVRVGVGVCVGVDVGVGQVTS